jgi:hypothetical protein
VTPPNAISRRVVVADPLAALFIAGVAPSKEGVKG